MTEVFKSHWFNLAGQERCELAREHGTLVCRHDQIELYRYKEDYYFLEAKDDDKHTTQLVLTET